MGRFLPMAREMVGIREAVRGWDVSERSLRRKLTAGDIGASERAPDGSWLVPSDWLDGEFERTVIDLRDPVVSEGLAAVLSELSGMTEQVKQAEVRAAVAEVEVETLTGRLRATTDQLEDEQAEHQRLQHDFGELERRFAVQDQKLEQTEAEAERAWSTWEQTDAEATECRSSLNSQIDLLSKEVERANQKARLAQSMTSRRKRRFYERLAADIDESLG